MLKTLLMDQGLIRMLLAQAQTSVDADEFGETEWDKGRMETLNRALRVNPYDLKTWAMKELEWQQTESEMIQSRPQRHSHSIDYSEGCEAGYRDIIDELCAQEGHHDSIRA